MDRITRPEKFDIPPNTPSSGKHWKLWSRNFTYFLSTIAAHKPDELEVLFLHIGTNVVDIIQDCTSYADAIGKLNSAYLKTPNEVYARHLLSSRVQKLEENLDEFILALNNLASDCNFQNVTAEENRRLFIRDSFIRGLRSPAIRTRLLENKKLSLDDAILQAKSLEQAQINAESYASNFNTVASILNSDTQTRQLSSEANSHQTQSLVGLHESAPSIANLNETLATTRLNQRTKDSCYFCGMRRHPRQECPARDSTCNKCDKKGHWQKVCRSKQKSPQISAAIQSSPTTTLAASFVSAACRSPVTVNASIDGQSIKALIDSGSIDSNYICENLVDRLNLAVNPRSSCVSMASTNLTTNVKGFCSANVKLLGREYKNVELSILPELCNDIILGLPFFQRHEAVTFALGGTEPSLKIGDEPNLEFCALTRMKVETPKLFSNLTPDCHPIITKPRRFSASDEQFIEKEIQRLLKDNVIEPSRSPWRAQVVVTHNQNKKKRMVIDFSQTINRFTHVDAFPLPNIHDLVNKIGKNKFFSVIDLSSAYYQVEIEPCERPFTAFQAGGQLYQFTRIPMGVTNGAAAFQRVMNDIIKRWDLKETYAYLDDVTVCGANKEEHDLNLERFWKASNAVGLTINREKCRYGLQEVSILGYSVSEGTLRPDPERLRPLQELPIPHEKKSLQRLIGLLAYYAKWIPGYSKKIRPLIESKNFPLSQECRDAINDMKELLSQITVEVIREDIPFTIETDASDETIAATLTQEGRPVAFFSRSLNDAERRHHIVEKEAYAIVESIRKWRHFLTNHFVLYTDQRSVAFMFNNRAAAKIKNEKIQRWRIELSPLSYTIKYRPGKENIPADALTRAHCASVGLSTSRKLEQLHHDLAHPGVVRMLHFVRSKNLPYSVDDVRRVTSDCEICARCKPQFYKPPNTKLVKATSAFERLNIDFKGPIPASQNGNQYILTIIDEFSRFPFAYPCRDVSAASVIKCLSHLFSIFGMPGYVHSDRGAAFMSSDVKNFLTNLGVATSRTTPYHPTGNSQCERYNGIIWRTITLVMEGKRMSKGLWEQALPEALHSIRSLLCTSTNSTPHERLFSYSRRSTNGSTLPDWLTSPGTVLMKRHVRNSKSEPLVEQVELIEANQHYAYVKRPDGKIDSVSTRDLAPLPKSDTQVFPPIEAISNHPEPMPPDPVAIHPMTTTDEEKEDRSTSTADNSQDEAITVRRSTRQRKPVDRLLL